MGWFHRIHETKRKRNETTERFGSIVLPFWILIYKLIISTCNFFMSTNKINKLHVYVYTCKSCWHCHLYIACNCWHKYYVAFRAYLLVKHALDPFISSLNLQKYIIIPTVIFRDLCSFPDCINDPGPEQQTQNNSH